jgi:hypothetical protein
MDADAIVEVAQGLADAARPWAFRVQPIKRAWCDGPNGVWWKVGDDHVTVWAADVADRDRVIAACQNSGVAAEPRDSQEFLPGHLKIAYSPFLRGVAENLQFLPSTSWMPNAPSPVTAMLATGLLGSGIGYGAGAWLGKEAPDDWDRNRLRRTGAILGGLLGAAPGAVWAGVNLANGKSPFSSWPHTKAGDWREAALAETIKAAGESFDTGLGGLPPVHVNSFGQTLWNDPFVSGGLKPGVAGATMAALRTASQLPGSPAPGWVSVRQMANLAAGMGTGYITGALVGGILGTLAGAPPSTRQLLKQTGMYAGLVNAAVPELFGQR